MPTEKSTVAGPQVDYVLPEVISAIPLWATVRDCVDGQAAIKAKGTTYLPMPNVEDQSPENVARYSAYQTRGIFANFTARTLQGMTGTVFSKDAEATLPKELEIMHEDIDGGSVTMDQQAKKVLSDVISVGRCGLLSDYPPVDGRVSRQQVIRGEIRPTIQFYFAENIINWRTTIIKGLRKLTLVVLAESNTVRDDGFKIETERQYRVLRLTNGVYTTQTYQKSTTGVWTSTDLRTPTQASGKPFDYIPFEFIGSDNNDPGIDSIPLLDLANLNIGHYRNSCDFEEMVFLLGQPTPIFTGLTKDWVDTVLDGRIVLGSNVAVSLPEGAAAQLLQITESALALEAMEHKERQAVALGARLVQQQTVQRTATEAGMEEASETSLLLSSAKNVNSAYKNALKSAALFAGAAVTDDIGYELNTDFDILRLDSPGRAQLLAEWQRGALTFSEYRSILRRAGVATLDDAQAQAELDAEAQRNMENMGLNPNVQNDGVTPVDKNAPPNAANSPLGRAVRGTAARKAAKKALKQ